MRLRSTETTRASDAEPSIASRQDQSIGALLLEAKLLSPEQSAIVMARQQETGRLFGEVAIELGYVASADIDKIVARQNAFPILEADDPRIDRAVVAAFDPNDPLARAARELRGQITSAHIAEGSATKAVAIVGVDTGAEAGLIAANLAVSCAQAGYRTLLVDANVNEPVQHGLFRLPNRTGLTALLSRATDFGGAVQATAIPRVMVLTAGPAVPNAPELFEREQLFRRLKSFSDSFDIAIVDAGRAVSDELGILKGADASLIVVRSNVSDMRSFQDVVDRLEAISVPIIGSAFVDR